MITTLGVRPHELRRLLDSIIDEHLDGLEVIVVDQSPTGAAHDIARVQLAGSGVSLHCVTTGVGLCRGRNAGLEVATGALVTFPDDDAWYPRGGLTAIIQRIERQPGLDGLTFLARGSDGRISTTTFARRSGRVRRGHVFRQAVESTMVFRTTAVRRVNGFTPHIGGGSGTPWGAAEGPDLLLRLLADGATMSFDTALFLYHENPPVTGAAMCARASSYGRGAGYVVARNNLTVRYVYPFLIRPAVGMAIATMQGDHGLRRVRAARLRAHVRGLVDGLRART